MGFHSEFFFFKTIFICIIITIKYENLGMIEAQSSLFLQLIGARIVIKRLGGVSRQVYYTILILAHQDYDTTE